jgi:putative monooxygenase ydhR
MTIDQRGWRFDNRNKTRRHEKHLQYTRRIDCSHDERQECGMIGVWVTFRFDADFDEQAVRKIAEDARARFEDMPGLRSKAFTVNPGKREATNFYIWDSHDAAKAFFTDALLERVTALYGVRPCVEFVQIATLVENARRA